MTNEPCPCSAAAPPRGYLLNSRASLANSEGKAFAQPGLTSHGMPLSYISSPIHQSQALSSFGPQHSSPNIHTDDEPATSPHQTRQFETTESIATPRSSLLPPEPVLDTGVTIKEQILLQRRQGKERRGQRKERRGQGVVLASPSQTPLLQTEAPVGRRILRLLR